MLVYNPTDSGYSFLSASMSAPWTILANSKMAGSSALHLETKASKEHFLSWWPNSTPYIYAAAGDTASGVVACLKHIRNPWVYAAMGLATTICILETGKYDSWGDSLTSFLRTWLERFKIPSAKN